MRKMSKAVERDREHVRFAELSESVEDIAIVTPGSEHDPRPKSTTATAS